MSTLLFNLFVNDLALRIKSLGKGVNIGNENVSILMYADDIILIAENEEDLQHMLYELKNNCSVNSMIIKLTKSNIVHFRHKLYCNRAMRFFLGTGKFTPNAGI